jgi:proteasome-associated ATPase
VKHITKRLSEGDPDVIHRNDEQAREIEKLRVQIQSMEEEIRRLYQSRYQLDQANWSLPSRKPKRKLKRCVLKSKN